MAILLPFWLILGATLRILAPALLDFFGNSSLQQAKVEKLSQESLRTFIFCIFGASGRRFSSLSALRFLNFRLCCPSYGSPTVRTHVVVSHTFCTYPLRVFRNTAGHQIVLRRLLREACSIRRASPEDWCIFAPSPFPGSSECEPPSPCWHICRCPRALNLSFSHPFCSQVRLPWLILGIFVATSCQEGLK